MRFTSFGLMTGAGVLASLLAVVAALVVPAVAGAHKWGNAIVSGDGSRAQACKVYENSVYGAVWRIQVREDNRRGTAPAIVRARVLRGYFDAGSGGRPPTMRGVVISAWGGRVARGRVSREATLHASILKRDALIIHQRRDDRADGGLTWIIDPDQLPPCGMRPRRRHWESAIQNDRTLLQTCSALVSGPYGPVYTTWGRGNNALGPIRRSMGISVRRGDDPQPVNNRRVTHQWNVTLDPGEISNVHVVHASLFQPDRLVGGIGDVHGGLGGWIEPRDDAIC
jgi:hypothetical protein